jgi:hypothetical protein
MALLRDTLRKTLIVSVHGRRRFVPEGVIQGCLNDDQLKDALSTSNIDKVLQREAEEEIRRGGHKTFGVLVLMREEHLIVNFLQRDQLLRTRLDERLPRQIEELVVTLGSKERADEFYESQWQFLAPVFSELKGHRLLHEETILPFLAEEYLGQGGFGKVYKTRIHQSHWLLPLGPDGKASTSECQFFCGRVLTTPKGTEVSKEGN